jgi:hypothetical protein
MEISSVVWLHIYPVLTGVCTVHSAECVYSAQCRVCVQCTVQSKTELISMTRNLTDQFNNYNFSTVQTISSLMTVVRPKHVAALLM